VKRLERMCENLAKTAGAHHQAEIGLQNELIEAKNDYAQLWNTYMKSMDTSRRLFERLKESNADFVAMANERDNMTEARDAVAAASKFLRDRCDMQAAVLKMIALYGAANPTWAVKIAKAAVESEC